MTGLTKEYNSLTAIIFEFNHQYKASTGFDAKNLSDESLKRVTRSYIKSPESLKDDYDDLESNKVLIEEYLKTDYGSKHGVIVKVYRTTCLAAFEKCCSINTCSNLPMHIC